MRDEYAHAEIAELKRRIEELERKLARLAAQPPRLSPSKAFPINETPDWKTFGSDPL